MINAEVEYKGKRVFGISGSFFEFFVLFFVLLAVSAQIGICAAVCSFAYSVVLRILN